MKKDYNVLGHNVRLDLSGILPCVCGMIIGLILLICPGATVSLLLSCIGVVLIVIGFADVVRFLIAEKKASPHENELMYGLVWLSGGVITIVFKEAVAGIMPLFFGFVILIGGFYKLQGALMARHEASKRWLLLLVSAALSVIVGVLIVVQPFSAALFFMRFIGAGLVYECVADFIYKLMLAKKKKAEAAQQ